MKCGTCGCEIVDDDVYEHGGKNLCEDCYIDALNPAKPCDPWAVHLASRSIDRDGAPLSEQLSPLQNSILEYLEKHGRATVEELMKEFDLTEARFRTEIATLRHCDLVTGRKENDSIYFVPAG